MRNDWIAKVGEAHTADEMRAELFRLSRDDHLVRSVFNHADYRGLSGEEKYLLLAYNAMRDRNNFMRQLYDWTMSHPAPSPFIELREIQERRK